MYLVELQQGDRRHTVGLFREKKEAKEWIEALPYVRKESEVFGGQEFVTYTLNYEDLPLYEEIEWKGSRYPFTKYMFTPDDGRIELFIWNKLPIIGEVEGRIEGMTQVDAYLIPNEETESYITAREEVRNTITMHYERMGKRVEAGGVGSQDGEYLIVEDGPFVHLDASTIQQWQEKSTVEYFIKQIES
ncbi:hypothetical protein [Carnobacterium mobile]|uniref:hypothetical protein n=1 Tax=Carnobacterium mobile TaxID=2750 RepID=UPI001867DC49|nr:hypothetical protein [Carnobacterium mobile]